MEGAAGASRPLGWRCGRAGCLVHVTAGAAGPRPAKKAEGDGGGPHTAYRREGRWGGRRARGRPRRLLDPGDGGWPAHGGGGGRPPPPCPTPSGPGPSPPRNAKSRWVMAPPPRAPATPRRPKHSAAAVVPAGGWPGAPPGLARVASCRHQDDGSPAHAMMRLVARAGCAHVRRWRAGDRRRSGWRTRAPAVPPRPEWRTRVGNGGGQVPMPWGR